MPPPHTSIVITTINPPTHAVRLFATAPNSSLFVVGDLKSPLDWTLPGATYLSVADQERLPLALSTALPWKHYARKMLGYILAAQHGAQIIVDTDDDNIPEAGWNASTAFPAFDGNFALRTTPGFVNIYKYFTDMHIWPRGLPLPLITAPLNADRAALSHQPCRVGIWQGLADGDPDVDAIYRLVDNRPCTFRKEAPIVLAPGAICPFNSQNTAVRRELFPLLYLPATVTFRFTDILRGLVAQPIMWKYGYTLGFSRATVLQERNPHDYLKDFESEVSMYLQGERVVDLVRKALAPTEKPSTPSVPTWRELADDLRAAYAALIDAGIVPQAEQPVLDAWLADLAISSGVASPAALTAGR